MSSKTTYSQDLGVVADSIALIEADYKGMYAGLLAELADEIATRLELPEEWRDRACPWSADPAGEVS